MVCVRAAVPVAVPVAVPAAVMLAVGLWGIDRGGIWRDEAVTYQVAGRTVPQIWRLLHGVDAVHGLYYLLMHVVLALHPGEVVLRLPSVCAATVTAGLVAALGVRLAGRRVGLWAGLLYAVTPLAGHYAQEGRSYALVAAGAAGATLLLVRAVEERRLWWRYGGVVAVTCLLHELAVFMLCAHAVTLALLRVPRGVWWRWGRAAGAAVVVLLPLVLVSHGQSRQVEWLPVPDRGSAERLLRSFAVGPEGVVFWGCVMLMVAGLWAGRTAAVMAPLMVVPPTLLILLSQVRPLYHERYVLYALAGAPLLIAAGADRLARLARRAGRPRSWTITPAGVLLIAVVFVDLLPLHRQYRTLAHRPDNLAAISALATREVRPGDPVLFLPSLGRRAALAYPKGFQGARDLALKVPGAQSGTLYGREVGPRELRRRLAGVSRLWIVAEPYTLRSHWLPGDPTERAKLLTVEERFTPRREYDRPDIALRLYTRRPPAGPSAAGTRATGSPTAGTRQPLP